MIQDLLVYIIILAAFIKTLVAFVNFLRKKDKTVPGCEGCSCNVEKKF